MYLAQTERQAVSALGGADSITYKKYSGLQPDRIQIHLRLSVFIGG